MVMSFALFIVGTSHTLQCSSGGTAPEKAAAYRVELQRLCLAHGVARLAEEMSKDGLQHQGVSHTVGYEVAAALGIEHQHVELELLEQHALGLGDATTINVLQSGYANVEEFRRRLTILLDDVRERCWIGRILAGQTWPALFVCGADHVESMARLWGSLDFPAVILHADLDPLVL